MKVADAQATTPQLTRHRARVLLGQRDRSALLRVVSTLHRRGVDAGDVRMTTDSRGRFEYDVSFVGTDRQAATVIASLRNLVHVLDAELVRR